MSSLSVCPVCLKRIEAQKERIGDKVYLCKTCPEHGFFRTLIWNGGPDYDSWDRRRGEVKLSKVHTQVKQGCPYDCGICEEHKQNTCCVLLEITQRCNMRCPVCFASAGETVEKDPSLEEISAWFDLLMESGGPYNIQLSGGEPTVREDVPQIIRLGREKGFTFFQLNTNGLRLAQEAGYAQKLKMAGLNCVFLQFDGLEDDVYHKLRGRPMLKEKMQAIDACIKADLGVVLVPTVAPGVNDHQIGAILQFAEAHLPGVRGVHFQPISYFGRYPERPDDRITIPDMLRYIEQQTNGRMKAEDFRPGSAENPYCSFNGTFVCQDGHITAVKSETGSCCCGGDAAHTREQVARQWSSAVTSCCSNSTAAEECCCEEAACDCQESPCCCEEAACDCPESTCCCEEVACDCQESPCCCEEAACDCQESPCCCEEAACDCQESPCCCEEVACDCQESTCCCEEAACDCQETTCCCADASCENQSKQTFSLDDFIVKIRQQTLAVSGMLFQDAWNLELDRLKQCYIHVVSPNKKVIPFCAYNLTSLTGDTLYRGNLHADDAD